MSELWDILIVMMPIGALALTLGILLCAEEPPVDPDNWPY